MEAGKDTKCFREKLVEMARTINPDLTIIDGVIGHKGNRLSGGEPHSLGILGTSADMLALDQTMVNIWGVDLSVVPTVAVQTHLSLSSNLALLTFPLLSPGQLEVSNGKLPEALIPIDFGLPRVLRSTFKHFYIRFLQEPLKAYSRK